MEVPEGTTVLLVEDEWMLREVIADELADAGYAVTEASSGDRAIKLFGQKFDFLLTDIRMPGVVNGWDLAEAARATQPHIAVIYMTGYSNVPERRVPDSQLIAKPFSASEIITLMRGERPGCAHAISKVGGT